MSEICYHKILAIGLFNLSEIIFKTIFTYPSFLTIEVWCDLLKSIACLVIQSDN